MKHTHPLYAFLFTVLALAVVLLALQNFLASPVLLALFGFVALSCFLLAIGYAGVGARIFGKGTDGSLPWWCFVLLWPYLLMTAIMLWFVRRFGSEDAYNEILPGLFLGRFLSAGEARTSLPFVAVLDLTAECPETRAFRTPETYLALPTLDIAAPTQEQLHKGASWLQAQLSKHPVYVHCAAGHGRSATVICAYLLASGQADSPDAAISLVREKRPRVKLSSPQRKALAQLHASTAIQ